MAQSQRPEQPDIARGLEGEQEEEQRGDDDRVQRREPGQPDRDEEADEQQLLDVEERARQLRTRRMRGQEHAHDERAEVALEAHEIEEQVARHERHDDAEERLELTVADARPHRPDDPRQRPQPDEGQGPRVGQLAIGDREEDDRRDVLDDEDADRHPAVEGVRLTPILEHLDDEDGAGEGEREGDERGGRGVQTGDEREPGGAQPEDERGADGDAQPEVQARGEPHLLLEQAADVEFETDAEEEQRHAEAGDRVEDREVLDVDRVEHETSGEEADERWQAQDDGQEAKSEGDDEVHRDGRHASLSAGSGHKRMAHSLTRIVHGAAE